ncbi:DNA polymerase III subunit alpha [Streptacidiphilus sp. ASG 303]|uniref:DNA polymerase III subunit alpha n=1 Tax=Streptacidiphilus sp. ASG 303 TaxID=2896847 RepID=UPI001E4ACCE4|nr:DNA polymerase III subunit alpha [Streptacidiphilus sp. ASG 303]MCD0484825.1 DNA polymerase III subunit alpha [Streptacidiphilus sp. ASG 303]
MPGRFGQLQVASGFSLRHGADLPGRLARRAAERGLEALALTDRDTLAGAVKHAKACAEAGVRPLFGVDLALAPDTPDGMPAAVPGRRRSPARGGAFTDPGHPRAVLLAEDARGWAALCALVTAAHARPAPGRPAGATPSGTPGRTPAPALPFGELAARAAGGGVLVLLGPDSDVGRAVAAGRPDRARALLRRWTSALGPEAVRLAVVCHFVPGQGAGSVAAAGRTLRLADACAVAPVLTNAVRAADPGRGRVLAVLDAARRLVPAEPADRTPGLGEGWLKGPAEMARVAEAVTAMAALPAWTPERLLAATAATADRCVLTPDRLGLGRIHFPEEHLVAPAGRPAAAVLRERCEAGLSRRGLHRRADARRRLETELAVVDRLGLPSYFLTVAEVADLTRRAGIRVAARGSGAGSLVTYLLGISQVDPLEHGLLMERFLSERRRALPDIDLDVESHRRLEVYRLIRDRFGTQRTCAVATAETWRVRHAVRDVAAALGLDPDEADTLAKAFPHIRARDARAALAELPELRGPAARTAHWEGFWELVEALDGLSRGTAMHPCGVVLSDASLTRRTPLLPTAVDGMAMTVFDKDDVEDLGLLKLDVLGVRMQSAMAHALAEIARTEGRTIDLDDPAHVPPGDPATYRMIRRGDTLGCFQIESPGQRDLVARIAPACLADLIVDISLFRPGPVQSDMITPYLDTRHGRRRPAFPHPDLAPVLAGTGGVVVFHEQVIRMVALLTGTDHALGDEARRALGTPAGRDRVHAWFTAAARARGYTPDVVDRIWGIVAAFGNFGFCKAHAAAFAVPTYQSAWLKTHHPAAFYAGLLTHDPGMYPKRLILGDARRHGVPVLPPDVNASDAPYRAEPLPDGRTALRIGLQDLAGITAAELARIPAARPYASLTDWWHRARPTRPTADRLALVGALDTLAGVRPGGPTRRDVLLHIADLHHGARPARQDRRRAGRPPQPADPAVQLPLALEDGHPAAPAAPAGLPETTPAERLRAELELLGLDLTRHVLADHHRLLAALGVLTAADLRRTPDRTDVLVAGAKVAVQSPHIRSGRRILFASLDDHTGVVDTVFFDTTHAQAAHTLAHAGLLLVAGRTRRTGPHSVSVTATAAFDLARLAALHDEHGLQAVRDHLDTGRRCRPHPAAGAGRVLVHPTGALQHPWADLRGPGPHPTALPRRLWHASPGSAG